MLYHQSNLVYTVVFPQFLIFQKKKYCRDEKKINIDVSALLFCSKLKNCGKQLCKLNCSYGKVSHAHKFVKNSS